jgi:hypothetical protein
MAYPVFYPFKTRVLNATSSSSNGFMSVAVPARAKYVGAVYAPSQLTSQTAAVNTCEIVLFPASANSATATVISSGTACAITTTTGTAGTAIPITASTAIFLSVGDILATQLSSCVGGTTSYIVQEF